MGAQGSVTNAKEDTVYLATGGAPAVTDESQVGTDLTTSGDGGYELTSSRASLSGDTGRELYVAAGLDENWGVTLAAHYETTGETNLAYYMVYRAASGGAYYNDTTDANDAGTNDTWLGISPGNSPGVNDARYIASLTTFNCVTVDVSTAYVATQTLVLEYWNGATWVPCSNVVDRTRGYKNTGKNRITFDLPDDWAITSVNGQGPYYWVRHRVSSHTSVTTLAMATTVKTETLTYTWGIETDEAARFMLKQGTGTVYLDDDSGNIASGACHVHWSTRPNPDTTGAGDRLLSEVAINYAGTRHLAQFTHANPVGSSSRTFSVGGLWLGGALVHTPTLVDGVTDVRVGKAWHPHTEYEEDWIASRSPHSHTYEQPLEPLGAGAAVGSKAGWAGQANAGFAAAHANGLRGRLLSPLIRETYPQAPTLSTSTWTGGTEPKQRWMPAPGGATLRLDCTTLRKLNVRGIRWAHVRVHVQSWVTTGSAVPIEIRCYAMNRPHVGLGVALDGHPMPGLQYAYASGSLTVNHGSGGVGQWLDLGALPLPAMAEQIPGWLDTVTLALGFLIDPAGASSNDANARLKIKAWQVLPILGDP